MLPESFEADMAEVREKIGASSDSEVIRRAFRLYKKLMEFGGEIMLKHRDGKTTLLIPD